MRTHERLALHEHEDSLKRILILIGLLAFLALVATTVRGQVNGAPHTPGPAGRSTVNPPAAPGMPTTGPTAPGNNASGTTIPGTVQPGVSTGETNASGQPMQPAPISPNSPTNSAGMPAQAAPGTAQPTAPAAPSTPATGNPFGQNTGR